MRLSAAFLALAIAGVFAGPLDRRDEVIDVTIFEEVDYYVNARIASKAFHTFTCETTVFAEHHATHAKSTVASQHSESSVSPQHSVVATPNQDSVEPVSSQYSAAPVSSESSASVSVPLQSSSASATASTSTVPTAAPTPSDVYYSGWVVPQSQEFIDICVFHHNVHRANHSAPAVTYNQTIGDWAQAKANTCVYNENAAPGSSNVGMNIAGGTYSSSDVPNPSGMISMIWYNGEINNYPGYGIANPPGQNFESWGHFSQVVWPASIQIGCGLQDCGSTWFGVCLYSPEGNILGDFEVIQKPLGYPTVYANGESPS